MSGSKFASFDPHSGQKWEVYYQRFLFHCTTKKCTTDAERKAELLSCASDDFFEYVQGLCRKELHDGSLSFADICTALGNHLSPQTNQIVAAGKFHARNQLAGESVSEFIGELKKLARAANFPAAAYDRIMRDRFVLGLAETETQAWLFRMGSDLELEKAIETALAVEASTQNVASASQPNGLNFVGGNQAKHNNTNTLQIS